MIFNEKYMINFLTFILCCIMLFSLTACGESYESETDNIEISSAEETMQENTAEAETEAPAENEAGEQTETGSSSLVVYFSWSGNTRTIANEIAKRQERIFLN